jgi:hypothetical protein
MKYILKYKIFENSYKLFESYDDIKSVLKDVMDDIEDEFGFDCLYHNGYGWSYPCDLALVVPLHRVIGIHTH